MQTNKLTDKPFEQIASAIQALDLTSVKRRVMDPDLGEGWTQEHADSVEVAYKTYLTMVAKYQDDAEDILLAKDVDEFWHTHILQTMKYAADCQAVFGTFLHHDPHVGEITQALHDKRARLAEKTRSLYEREFGSTGTAEAAWAGRPDSAAAAMSNVAIRATDSAMSNVAFRATDSAMSNVAFRAASAAMSNVAFHPDGAAMSNVAIRAEAAAMSNVAIHADRAAMSNVAFRAENAAMSNVAFRAENAAMSNVAFRAENAAMSNVALHVAASASAGMVSAQ